MEPRPNILRSGGAPLPRGRASSVREIVESTADYREFIAAYETLSRRLQRMREAIDAQIRELGA